MLELSAGDSCVVEGRGGQTVGAEWAIRGFRRSERDQADADGRTVRVTMFQWDQADTDGRTVFDFTDECPVDFANDLAWGGEGTTEDQYDSNSEKVTTCAILPSFRRTSTPGEFDLVGMDLVATREIVRGTKLSTAYGWAWWGGEDEKWRDAGCFYALDGAPRRKRAAQLGLSTKLVSVAGFDGCQRTRRCTSKQDAEVSVSRTPQGRSWLLCRVCLNEKRRQTSLIGFSFPAPGPNKKRARDAVVVDAQLRGS